MASEFKFRFSGEVTLTSDQIWMDSCIKEHLPPDSPTVQDVMVFVRGMDSRPKMAMMGGLNLVPHIKITMSGPGGVWEIEDRTERVWHCHAIPQTLESDKDGGPLRSEACIAAQQIEQEG